MKKSAIVMGILCGLAGTAWIVGHGRGSEDTEEARKETSRPEKRSGGARWLPWQTGPKVEVEPEIVKGDAKYEGEWVEVPVRVVDVEGKPVSGATVEIRAYLDAWATSGMTDEQYDEWLAAHPEPETEEEEYAAYEDEQPMAPVATGRTDRKGAFLARLKPDVEVVIVARDGKAEGKSEPYYAYSMEYATEEEKAEALVPITIEIGEVAILSGIVQDESGRPISGAFLDLWPLDPDSYIDDAASLAESDSEDPFETDEDGRFHIKLRAWGAFEVSFEADGRRRHTEPVVQLLPGRETELSITLEATAELAGIVVDDRGEPVAQASVSAIDRDGLVLASAATLPDGAFSVDAPADSRLQVTATGFRTAITQAADGATVRLSRGGTLAVTLAVSREVMNEGVSNIAVYLASPDGDVPMVTGETGAAPHLSIPRNGRYFQNVVLDENGQGTVSITGLPPGSFQVTLTAGAAAVVHPRVTVYDGGETELSASIPDGTSGVLEGIVHAPRAVLGGSLYLSQQGAIGIQARVLAGGKFRFESVPAGEWTLGGSVEVDGAAGSPQAAALSNVDSVVLAVGMSERRTVDVHASQTLTRPAYGDGDFAVDEGEYEAEYEEEPGRFLPDLAVEELETGLVVMRAAGPGKRLFGGDTLQSIDGTQLASVEEWERYELLYGEEGTTCRIVAVRPATGETITVSLPRTVSEDAGYYH